MPRSSAERQQNYFFGFLKIACNACKYSLAHTRKASKPARSSVGSSAKRSALARQASRKFATCSSSCAVHALSARITADNKELASMSNTLKNYRLALVSANLCSLWQTLMEYGSSQVGVRSELYKQTQQDRRDNPELRRGDKPIL